LHQFTKTPSDLRFLDLFNLSLKDLPGIFFTELEDDVALTPFLVFSKRVVSVLEMQAEDKVLEEEQEMESSSLFPGEHEQQVTRLRDGVWPENGFPVIEPQPEQITRRAWRATRKLALWTLESQSKQRYAASESQ
jgi:hypothetical protein